MSDTPNELKARLRESERKTTTAERTLAEFKRRRLPQMAWSAIAGFLLFAIGGQWFPGYQLDSTAEAAAAERADEAVSEVMAELCAERFMRTAGLDSRLSDLNDANGDWGKAKFIREGTWAATPDGAQPDHATAEKCRDLIAKRVTDASEKAS